MNHLAENKQQGHGALKRPVLITGTHRSGSTWVGQMLSAGPGTGYIHEPFNIAIRIGPTADVFDCWFRYVWADNEERYMGAIADTLQFRYPLRQNLRKIKTWREGMKILKDQGLFWRYQMSNAIPVIKDPIAFFSAEWMAKRFDVQVVVLIRHPAAFCSSLKLQSWQFDFNHLLRQPKLLETFLLPFADEIERFALEKRPLIEQSVLFWKCFHHTIKIYQDAHPEWIFLRHEDLSASPIQAFEVLYNRLGYDYTTKVEAYIQRRSGLHNPTEQNQNNEFVRNSRANIRNWKQRLTAAEIEFVRAETAEISSLFYQPSDW